MARQKMVWAEPVKTGKSFCLLRLSRCDWEGGLKKDGSPPADKGLGSRMLFG
jgi:hypothetical protein